jgi:hypothetical protein
MDNLVEGWPLCQLPCFGASQQVQVPGTNPGVGIFTRASNPRRWRPLSNGNET